jgi:hypothetical protein
VLDGLDSTNSAIQRRSKMHLGEVYHLLGYSNSTLPKVKAVQRCQIKPSMIDKLIKNKLTKKIIVYTLSNRKRCYNKTKIS